MIIVLVIVVVFLLLLLLDKPREYIDQVAGKAIFPALRQCNDHVDNDGDEFVDFPKDSQCADPTDDNEKA